MTNELTPEAAAIVAQAQGAYVEPRRVDYDALNRMVRRQRSALTRAERSGNPSAVVLACRAAVREWDAPGAMWPDDWSRWQRALDDAVGWPNAPRLEDLR